MRGGGTAATGTGTATAVFLGRDFSTYISSSTLSAGSCLGDCTVKVTIVDLGVDIAHPDLGWDV